MEKNEVITLEDRGFIQVKGPEAKDFLQNIVTNDLEKVTNESTIFSSILTPQGKYLFEFFVIKLGDNFLLENEKKSTEEFDVIVNCVASLRKDNWLDTSESDCNVLENKINSISFNKFIHLSSYSVFSELSKLTGNPEPQYFYGLAKLVSEKILKRFLLFSSQN